MRHISIPCFRTILDVLDDNSKHNTTAKIFFSTLAVESGKSPSNRKHYGIITNPIFELLYDVIFEIWNEYVSEGETDKIKEKIEIISLILSGLDNDPFHLRGIEVQESIFEMARLLNDEKGLEIDVVSNDEGIYKTRSSLMRKNSDKDYSFEPINTDQWMAKHFATL